MIGGVWNTDDLTLFNALELYAKELQIDKNV